MRVRGIVAVACVLLATGLLVGCGGDDDGDQPEALTVEEYSAEVDEQLQDFNTELAELGDAARDPESREAYAGAVTAIQDRVEDIVATLEAIEPPPEAADFHAGLVAAMDGFAASFTGVIDAAESGDDDALLAAVEALRQANTQFATQTRSLASQAEEAGLDIPSLAGSE